MTEIPLTFLDDTTPQQVKALSPEQLEMLRELVQEALELNHHRLRVLEDGIHLKYFDAAQSALRTIHQDTGTIRIKDGPYVVVATLSKKVKWNQTKLGAIVEKIPPHERSPAILVKYSIHESHYKIWPPQKQALFIPARTVEIGPCTFELKKENLA